jgi:hypothetical protein
MTLESQLCSFELAQRLKELGVKQESLFCWTTDLDLEYLPFEIRNNEICIAAFTVSELGEMLPKYIIQEGHEYYYNQILSKHCDSWAIFYSNSFHFWDGDDVGDKNEANARAKMLIYLIENKLIALND